MELTERQKSLLSCWRESRAALTAAMAAEPIGSPEWHKSVHRTYDTMFDLESQCLDENLGGLGFMSDE